MDNKAFSISNGDLQKHASLSYGEGAQVKESLGDKVKEACEREAKDNESKDSAGGRRRRRFVIEPALTLYAAVYSVLAPLTAQYVLSEMMKEFNVSSNGNDTNTCGDSHKNSSDYRLRQEAQAASAQFTLLYNFTQGIPACFVTLYLGSYSDRNGRRLALLLPTVGIILRCLSFAVQQAFNLPIWVTLIGTTLDGLSGSNTILVTTCYAYISDTVEKEKRSSHILIAECIMNTFQGLLQLAMGYVISALGYFWPFVALICLMLLELLYIILFVPESRPVNSGGTSASPLLIVESFKTVLRKRSHPESRAMLLIFLTGYAFLVFGQAAQFGLEELHLLNPPICMDSILLGFWKTARLLLFSLTMVLSGKFLLPKVGDVNIVILGSLSLIVYFILFPLVSQLWMAFAVLIPCFAGYMGLPVAKTVLSKMVSSDEQGGLISMLYVIYKVCQLAGSAVFNNIYAATLAIFRPATYWCLAAVMSTGLVFVTIYKCRRKKTKTDIEMISQRF